MTAAATRQAAAPRGGGFTGIDAGRVDGAVLALLYLGCTTAAGRGRAPDRAGMDRLR
jgi:hypothetical protein